MSPKGTSYIQPAQKTDWETPRDLFDKLWDEFGGFDMDPACTPEQYTARRVLENGGRICIPPDHPIEDDEYKRLIFRDGLTEPWVGKVWLQPPYGLALRVWTDKAVAEAANGNALFVVALVPSKTDTIWWQRNVVQRAYYEPSAMERWWVDGSTDLAEVRFLPSRLTFHGAPDPAGFASAIVVWRR